jgi:hypothetical protein
MPYPWYEQVSPGNRIEQGDIVLDCSLLVPDEEHYRAIITSTPTEKPINIKQINAIILSQSCDILNEKIDSLIVCPIWSLKTLLHNEPYYLKTEARNELRKGNSPSYHLLNKCRLSDETEEDYYFVDFHNIYSVPKNIIAEMYKTTSRTRLLPPYREHLAQSFARYFMRVGLPSDISTQEIKDYRL